MSLEGIRGEMNSMRLLSIKKLPNIFSRLRTSALFRDSFWAIVGGVFGKGLAFVGGIIIARILGSSTFGEYSVIRSTLTYIAIITTFVIGYKATKFIAEYVEISPSKVNHLIRMIKLITVITGLFFTILQLVCAEEIAEFLKAPHLSSTIRKFSILTFLNAVTTSQLSILAGLRRFKKVAIINIVSGLIIFILSIAFSYYFGLNGALMSLLIAYIVQAIISEFAIYRYSNHYIEGRSKITTNELYDILYYSFPVALQDSFYAVAHWLSTYILVIFASYSEVGMLNAATIWQTMIVSIPIMLKNVMLSHLSSPGDSRKLVKRFFFVNLIASAIPAVVVIMLSKFIGELYGETYNGIQPIIIMVSLSSRLICLGEVFVYELLAKNKSWLVFMSRFTRDVITLLATYFILCNINYSQALIYTIIAFAVHVVYLILIYYMYRVTINKYN